MAEGAKPSRPLPLRDPAPSATSVDDAGHPYYPAVASVDGTTNPLARAPPATPPFVAVEELGEEDPVAGHCAPSPEGPPGPLQKAATDWLELTSNCIFVSLWSMLGALARYGLEQLFGSLLHTVDPSGSKGTAAALFLDLPANVVGSFVMGVFCGLEKHMVHHKSWLFVGVTSGFCGCCTTLSAWMTAAAYTMWGPPEVDVKTVFQGFNCIFIGLTAAYCSLVCGWRTSETLATRFPVPADHPTINKRFLCLAGFLLLVGAEVGLGVGYAGAEGSTLRMVLLALVWAPVGALLRYLLSCYNPQYPTFPLFTFAVNMLGTAVSAIIVILLWEDSVTPAIVSSADGQMALHALSLSFTGNLSTVSTFVKEIRVLDRVSLRHATVYVVTTLLAAQLICALILPPFFAAIGQY